MRLHDVLRSLVTRSGVVRVRTAVNDLLWTLPLAVAGCLISAYLIGPNTWVTVFFATVAAGLFVLFAFSHVYFMFRDPDRLQSEEYVLAQRELTILERRGEQPVVIDDRSRNDNLTVEMEAEPPSSEGVTS